MGPPLLPCHFASFGRAGPLVGFLSERVPLFLKKFKIHKYQNQEK